MTFVIIGGGIDLSVGSVLGLSSVVATLSAVQNLAEQSSWLVMVLVAVAVGVAAGVINGIVVSYGNVVAFMATLAMLVAAGAHLSHQFDSAATQIRIRLLELDPQHGLAVGRGHGLSRRWQ